MRFNPLTIDDPGGLSGHRLWIDRTGSRNRAFMAIVGLAVIRALGTPRSRRTRSGSTRYYCFGMVVAVPGFQCVASAKQLTEGVRYVSHSV